MAAKKNPNAVNIYAVLGENNTVHDGDAAPADQVLSVAFGHNNNSPALVLGGSDEEAPLDDDAKSNHNNSSSLSLLKKDKGINEEEALRAITRNPLFIESSSSNSPSLILAAANERKYQESHINKDKQQGEFNLFMEETIVFEDASTKDDHEWRSYPTDSYSFLSLHGPIDEPYFFFFGMLPFIFQFALLTVMVFSVVNETKGTIGEVDNPDGDGFTDTRIVGWFAKFIPANSNVVVKITQVLAILAFMLFPESSLLDVIKAVEVFPRFSQVKNDDKARHMVFSCILRLIQGIFAIFAVLLLVMMSNNVVEILLNFTAANFVSHLDDLAFEQAKFGRYGRKLEEEANRIKAKKLPVSMCQQDKHICYRFVLISISLTLFSFIVFIMGAQGKIEVWSTGTLRVQIDEEALQGYSGCYKISDSSSFFHRETYNSTEEMGNNVAAFSYCRSDRRWILFKGNVSDPCNISSDDQVLARSPKTDTFDISTSFDESWVSSANTPLDLYFFDGRNETAMTEEYCSVFLGDGKCDPVFNKEKYQYDGGDCCAATCIPSKCGQDLQSAFSINNSDGWKGFQHCNDPQMISITISLNNIKSSRDEEYAPTKVTDFEAINSSLSSVWGFEIDQNIIKTYQNEFLAGNNSDEFDGLTLFDGSRIWEKKHIVDTNWRKKPPVSPHFALDCNGKNVMIVYIKDSMINQTETVKIEDGAHCTIVLQNSTTSGKSDLYEDEPIWFVDYTVFHEATFVKNDDDKKKNITILSRNSNVSSVSFKIVPGCFFDVLGGYIDEEFIYTDLEQISNEAIEWLKNDNSTTSRCDDAFFDERFALIMLSLALDDKISLLHHDRQCAWSTVICDNDKTVQVLMSSIASQRTSLTKIPKSVFQILANVERLDLSKNILFDKTSTFWSNYSAQLSYSLFCVINALHFN